MSTSIRPESRVLVVLAMMISGWAGFGIVTGEGTGEGDGVGFGVDAGAGVGLATGAGEEVGAIGASDGLAGEGGVV